ncbi:pollen receptor-like kinase 4 [Prosopis cineraria]|uniref:pollen receptor-like kinase 4 n=1 Tax=Prosopis cineraria TaxID=364024 RepID=UPI00240F0B5A|nr:pollen receptor-like kinase 4 [Prosopis cineraria]
MGAHAALPVRVPAAIYSVLVVVLLLSWSSSSLSSSDAEALLKFKSSLNNVVALSNWDPGVNPKPPCTGNNPNWIGIFCINDTVWGFRLENMGLMGTIDVEALASMPRLRSISLMNNTFVGPLPEIKRIKNLKSIYLSYNHFTGDIPDDAFEGMNMLKKVYLANNQFTGKIPSSLGVLPNLLAVRLDGNKFHGRIPNFQNSTLKLIDFSNNALDGPIPENLTSFSAFAFSGNVHLCGPPLQNPCASIPYATMDSPTKTAILKILLILILTLLIIVVISSAIVIARLRTSRRYAEDSVSGFQSQPSLKYAPPAFTKAKSIDHHDSTKLLAGQNNTNYQNTASISKKGESGKLIFVRNREKKFDLQDLLKASAEILGSAAFGSSYKAVMKDDQAVVVKRYKQMNNVSRDEFFEHMARLGDLSHPNLLPLVAYYYRKEEKLLLSDFVPKGCLASQLHGNHNNERPGLCWPTRLKIVKGVARGLSYLYNALPCLVVPHGHLKSSNILLDESYEPLLTDYALIPVINLDHAQQIMMPYKSPEYAQLGRITKKTDVWSFGIMILEILTGKFPENYLTNRHDTSSDIASWVNSMVTEKRTGEVFDVEMGGAENSKSELLKLLKIGLSCCEENVERRLDMKEALEKIEELKDENYDGDFSLIVTSERDAFQAI